MPKSEKYKEIMAEVREEMKGLLRGEIGYYECIEICNTYTDILGRAEELIKSGNYYISFCVIMLVYINSAKLADKGDSSSGCIGDMQYYAEKLMDKICTTDSVEANEIFKQALKDCQNKAFDGWQDYAYTILIYASKLATKENIQKLYSTLDILAETHGKSEISVEVSEQWDCLVRINAIKAVEGAEQAEKYANKYLKHDKVRKKAIEFAIENKNFTHAEKLCIDYIEKKGKGNYYSTEWYEILLDIYRKSGNISAETELLKVLLLNRNNIIFLHNWEYYEPYKKILLENGTWEQEFPLLIAELEKITYPEDYAEILWKENKIELLLEFIKKHTELALKYTQKLKSEYSDITFPLCIEEIRNRADNANKREKYQAVCGEIKKLAKCGCDVMPLIDELENKYPKRTAFLDELRRLKVKI